MKYDTRVIDKLLHCLLSCVVVLCSFVYFMIYSMREDMRCEIEINSKICLLTLPCEFAVQF